MKNACSHLFLAVILGISTVSYSQQTKNKSWKQARIPTQEEVGAKMLPVKIYPVKAPFKTIPFINPNFPAETVKLSLSHWAS